ncbi:MAG: DUF3592 domain-containing protein [Patescibacteria group bacterium]
MTVQKGKVLAFCIALIVVGVIFLVAAEDNRITARRLLATGIRVQAEVVDYIPYGFRTTFQVPVVTYEVEGVERRAELHIRNRLPRIGEKIFVFYDPLDPLTIMEVGDYTSSSSVWDLLGVLCLLLAAGFIYVYWKVY